MEDQKKTEKQNKIRELLSQQDYPSLLYEMGVDERIMSNPAWKDLLSDVIDKLRMQSAYSDIHVEEDEVRLSKKIGDNCDNFTVRKGMITTNTYEEEQYSPVVAGEKVPKTVSSIKLGIDQLNGNVTKSHTRSLYFKPSENYNPLQAQNPNSYAIFHTSFEDEQVNSQGIMMERGRYVIETHPTTPYQTVHSDKAFSQQNFVDSNYKLSPDHHSGIGIRTDDASYGVDIAQVAYRYTEDLAKIYIMESGKKSQGRSGRVFCQLRSEHGLSTIDSGLFTYGNVGCTTYTEGEYAKFIKDSKERYDIVGDERSRLQSTAPAIAEAVMASVDKTYGKGEGFGQK